MDIIDLKIDYSNSNPEQQDALLYNIDVTKFSIREWCAFCHCVRLSLPKAARKRVLTAKPEDVAAFGSADSYGANEARWVEAGWRIESWHEDTKDGTAARILHWRGREWCESLEVA